jgi:hypothetical protein
VLLERGGAISKVKWDELPEKGKSSSERVGQQLLRFGRPVYLLTIENFPRRDRYGR